MRDLGLDLNGVDRTRLAELSRLGCLPARPADGVPLQFESTEPGPFTRTPGGVLKTFDFEGVAVREEVARTPGLPGRQKQWREVLQAYRSAGVFCPRLSPYPFGSRNIFSFRVDADEYDRTLFDRFYSAAFPHRDAVSIFFNMSNYAGHADPVSRCEADGFDVHSHAFIHHTYRSKEQNRANLLAADAALRSLGIPKRGFASPYGRWNPGLQELIDELGYTFSSEFSYDYDEMPSRPAPNPNASSVLQVPVHPIGLGVYAESTGAIDLAKALKYFTKLFAFKLETGEPIIFYDHPTKWLGVHPEFLDILFGLAGSHSGIWKCSMSQWADWWKFRETVSARVLLDDSAGELVLDAAVPDGSRYTAALDIYDADAGTKSTVALKAGVTRVKLALLRWEPAERTAAPSAGALFRDNDPLAMAKRAAKRWLDWETSTPTNELLITDTRTLLKRSLRRLSR